MWQCEDIVDECPEQAPINGVTPCGSAGQVCPYGDTECVCERDGMGGAVWQCEDTVDECPEQAPIDGVTPCETEDLVCPYGDTECACEASGPGAVAVAVWQCEDIVDDGCPSQAPDDRDPCLATGGAELVCEYQDTTCTCAAMGPNANQWSCEPGTGGPSMGGF